MLQSLSQGLWKDVIYPREDPSTEMSSYPATDFSGVLQLDCLGLLCSRDSRYLVLLEETLKKSPGYRKFLSDSLQTDDRKESPKWWAQTWAFEVCK